uniref:BZIP domain-containing protein n=1 Tax=Clastoptera arizonana TaxID=38151 RepID=A0A1B6DII2_9HEMI
MYNLNMSGPGGNNLLIPQGEASSTPRTPEILNSLIAMTNPFDSYRSGNVPRLASSPPGGSDTLSSSSGSPSCASPPSVQHTCSQLIKEGLKLTIQTKRRQTERSSTSTSTNDDDSTKVARRDEVSRDSLGDDEDDFSAGDGLTPEDEERRRRRRERNKIAATKCRLKKRERTVNLVQESEILENQNHDLKSQIQELETQRRRLVDMLSVHRPSCTKPQHYNNIDNSQTFTNQPFHRVDSNYTRVPNAVTIETSTYRQVNISSYSSRPSSKSSVESSMAYRRMEISDSPYERPTNTVHVEPTYQRLEPVDRSSTYCQPVESQQILSEPTIPTYHNFDDNDIKDPSVMLISYSRSNNIENTPFLKMNDDHYTCQPNLINLDQSLTYIKPESSPATYQSPSSNFGRPISIDTNTPISPDYDNPPEGLDSPSIAPNTYQHFDNNSENTFTAGFPTDNVTVLGV